MITRRGLFLGAASILAAPSIVRAANLMPVRAVIIEIPLLKFHPLSAWFVPYVHGGEIKWASYGECMADLNDVRDWLCSI